MWTMKSINHFSRARKKCLVKLCMEDLQGWFDNFRIWHFLGIAPMQMKVQRGRIEVGWESCFNTNDSYSFADWYRHSGIISKDPGYLVYTDSDKSQLFPPANTGKNRDGTKFKNYSVPIADDVSTTPKTHLSKSWWLSE